MKIWIDLANSPHPLLFAPISEHLESLGHRVLVTARDNAQTVALARKTWPELSVIGAESPNGRARKARALADRVATLVHWSREARPDLALSHNSYAQIVAARATGVRTVTAMDFEHQPANHLAFRLAHRILLPEILRGVPLRWQGASPKKVRYYPGLKEELYLGRFEPDAGVARALGVKGPDRLLVVARTPPDGAMYHQFDNALFLDALRAVSSRGDTDVVVLTRHRKQREAIDRLGLPGVSIPVEAVDSRSLLISADLFLGAGGTMTREAALLGVPTYSLFAGNRPFADVWLERRGLLRTLHDPHRIELSASDGQREQTRLDLQARGEMLVRAFTELAIAT